MSTGPFVMGTGRPDRRPAVEPEDRRGRTGNRRSFRSGQDPAIVQRHLHCLRSLDLSSSLEMKCKRR
ncbi:hypothetical protein M8C21_033675 [Ambrosia artemisiifolia]|uniref:Uncharacterized protein n=1 Tax=Ambrosia artemisiifolia TaxID=4212 RepID=A0AAD5C790_AMBAR|nr:hypothetical protein M8C21_033675 [Ambrosia artemisiifolia]